MVLATVQGMAPWFELSSPNGQGQSNQLMSGYRCFNIPAPPPPTPVLCFTSGRSSIVGESPFHTLELN